MRENSRPPCRQQVRSRSNLLVDIGLSKKKGTGPSMTAGPLPNACYSIYPLVTTGAAGGGAFPLPKNGPPYCAQPATVSVSATAVSNASTFIEPPFVMTRQLDQGGDAATSAEKTQ